MNWQDAYNGANKVKCSCPWPSVQRSGSQALGLVLDIDLCCAINALDKLVQAARILAATNPAVKAILDTIEPHPLYNITRTDAAFVWDCNEMVDGPPEQAERTIIEPDGSTRTETVQVSRKIRRGPPPQFMIDRARSMGITIRNLV